MCGRLSEAWQRRDNRDPVDLLPSSARESMIERIGAWEGVLDQP